MGCSHPGSDADIFETGIEKVLEIIAFFKIRFILFYRELHKAEGAKNSLKTGEYASMDRQDPDLVTQRILP